MCNETKPCILVVDDRADSLEVIRALLDLNGFCTIGASTAGEVINILDERCCRGDTCPDLIILDIDLPDVRGGVLGRWIRAVYPDIPFIFLTAYGRLSSFTEEAKNLGAPFETKPIEQAPFVKLIGDTLRDFKTRRKVGSKQVEVPPVMAEHIRAVAADREHRG